MERMNPVRQWWWQVLADLRPTLRYFAERYPRLTPIGVRVRWLLHLVAGNPVQAGAVLLGVIVAAGSVTAVLFGVAVLVVAEVLLRVLIGRGVPVVVSVVASVLFSLPGSLPALVAVIGFVLVSEAVLRVSLGRRWPVLSWLAVWREAWRFRRRWPVIWAGVAAKTRGVQAEVGSSKEPIASAKLRPVVDHPAMSWWPAISWPVLSWWCGPPPGRKFSAFIDMAATVGANIPRVETVNVESRKESSSYGRLVVNWRDLLATPILPDWDVDTPITAVASSPRPPLPTAPPFLHGVDVEEVA